MINPNNVQMLHKRLMDYFCNSEFAITKDISKSVYELILENVDCDYVKLIGALETLIDNRNGNIAREFKDAGNVFDVSRNGAPAPCYVKGFMSGEYPMLYFFDENEKHPSFKIKSLKNQKSQGYTLKLETSITPEGLSSSRKALTDDENSYFLRVCELNFDKNGYELIDGMQAKTNTQQEQVLDKEMLCDDYRMFYTFLENTLERNGVNTLGPLTPTKFDLIFSVFYQSFRNVAKFDNEISMSDLVKMMNLVFVGDSSFVEPKFKPDGTIKSNNYTPAVDVILDDYAKSHEHKNFDVDMYDEKTNRHLNFKVTKSQGYMSVAVNDAMNNQSLASYLLGATNNGFTLFRNLRGNECKENGARMFTLNLSDNMFRLSIKRDIPQVKEVSEDVVLKVMPSGELVISSVIYRDTKYNSKQLADESEVQQKQA